MYAITDPIYFIWVFVFIVVTVDGEDIILLVVPNDQQLKSTNADGMEETANANAQRSWFHRVPKKKILIIGSVVFFVIAVIAVIAFPPTFHQRENEPKMIHCKLSDEACCTEPIGNITLTREYTGGNYIDVEQGYCEHFTLDGCMDLKCRDGVGRVIVTDDERSAAHCLYVC